MTAPSLLDELEGVVPGELDATAPAVIWLQLDTDGDNERRDESWAGRDGVTWCDESIGGLEIQYARADLYRDMAKRLEAAERGARVTKRSAETLCRIYFEIAAEAVGEDKVRAERDRRIHAIQEGEG